MTTPEEELNHWREKAMRLEAELEDCRKEAREFEETSKAVEAELELELKHNEAKVKDLTAVVGKYRNEVEQLRSRLDKQSSTESRQHSELTSELHSLKSQMEELRTYVRKLEQTNDDLERTNRANAVSIEDFEIKLNNAIEKNVILESELDEKEGLKLKLQRLKDETRDLKSELNFRVQDSNRVVEMGVVTPDKPPPTTPRVTPLSIVNDLLRKVGALETKLATYRKEEPKKHKTRSSSVVKE
jgi:DNA repair exonuclease SbcCD ATPase subunit